MVCTVTPLRREARLLAAWRHLPPGASRTRSSKGRLRRVRCRRALPSGGFPAPRSFVVSARPAPVPTNGCRPSTASWTTSCPTWPNCRLPAARDRVRRLEHRPPRNRSQEHNPTRRTRASFPKNGPGSHGCSTSRADVIFTAASYPEATDACYTWWSNRGQADKNVGWRLDYQIATRSQPRCIIYRARFPANAARDFASLLAEPTRSTNRATAIHRRNGTALYHRSRRLHPGDAAENSNSSRDAPAGPAMELWRLST